MNEEEKYFDLESLRNIYYKKMRTLQNHKKQE